MSNFKSIGQGVRGLHLPKIGGFPLTLNVALTTVLRTDVLHCDLANIFYVSQVIADFGPKFRCHGIIQIARPRKRLLCAKISGISIT